MSLLFCVSSLLRHAQFSNNLQFETILIVIQDRTITDVGRSKNIPRYHHVRRLFFVAEATDKYTSCILVRRLYNARRAFRRSHRCIVQLNCKLSYACRLENFLRRHHDRLGVDLTRHFQFQASDVHVRAKCPEVRFLHAVHAGHLRHLVVALR